MTTGLCHEASAAVDEAAAWLASMGERDWRPPLVVHLRERFGLSPTEACAAIAQANVVRHAAAIAAMAKENQAVTQPVSREARATA